MRAAGVANYGGPIGPLDVPVPADPGPGEVLVRVAAAGLGLWDTAVAAGAFGTDRPVPFAVSWEGSGVVEAVGPDVTVLAPGDRVFGFDRSAAWAAEFVLTRADAVAAVPAAVDLLTAAALPVAGVTAVQAWREDAPLSGAETVLIANAAGGTGSLVVQLASHLGARVLATTGSANLAYVEGLGAELVLDHGQGIEATLGAVRRRAPNGVDVLLDGVSADNFAALSAAVRDGGRAITITWPQPELRPDITASQLVSIGTPDRLRAVADLSAAGVLRPVVREALPFTEAAKAFELVTSGHGRGKVLIVADEVAS